METRPFLRARKHKLEPSTRSPTKRRRSAAAAIKSAPPPFLARGDHLLLWSGGRTKATRVPAAQYLVEVGIYSTTRAWRIMWSFQRICQGATRRDSRRARVKRESDGGENGAARLRLRTPLRLLLLLRTIIARKPWMTRKAPRPFWRRRRRERRRLRKSRTTKSTSALAVTSTGEVLRLLLKAVVGFQMTSTPARIRTRSNRHRHWRKIAKPPVLLRLHLSFSKMRWKKLHRHTRCCPTRKAAVPVLPRRWRDRLGMSKSAATVRRRDTTKAATQSPLLLPPKNESVVGTQQRAGRTVGGVAEQNVGQARKGGDVAPGSQVESVAAEAGRPVLGLSREASAGRSPPAGTQEAGHAPVLPPTTSEQNGLDREGGVPALMSGEEKSVFVEKESQGHVEEKQQETPKRQKNKSGGGSIGSTILGASTPGAQPKEDEKKSVAAAALIERKIRPMYVYDKDRGLENLGRSVYANHVQCLANPLFEPASVTILEAMWCPIQPGATLLPKQAGRRVAHHFVRAQWWVNDAARPAKPFGSHLLRKVFGESKSSPSYKWRRQQVAHYEWAGGGYLIEFEQEPPSPPIPLRVRDRIEQGPQSTYCVETNWGEGPREPFSEGSVAFAAGLDRLAFENEILGIPPVGANLLPPAYRQPKNAFQEIYPEHSTAVGIDRNLPRAPGQETAEDVYGPLGLPGLSGENAKNCQDFTGAVLNLFKEPLGKAFEFHYKEGVGIRDSGTYENREAQPLANKKLWHFYKTVVRPNNRSLHQR
ncbi:unnamed protein product [Amoebophrya sp. A120]|nr:unnamed protein product [Amoebophrya sp. A120]|eukprot:GSA120T00006790001.1